MTASRRSLARDLERGHGRGCTELPLCPADLLDPRDERTLRARRYACTGSPAKEFTRLPGKTQRPADTQLMTLAGMWRAQPSLGLRALPMPPRLADGDGGYRTAEPERHAGDDGRDVQSERRNAPPRLNVTSPCCVVRAETGTPPLAQGTTPRH